MSHLDILRNPLFKDIVFEPKLQFTIITSDKIKRLKMLIDNPNNEGYAQKGLRVFVKRISNEKGEAVCLCGCGRVLKSGDAAIQRKTTTWTNKAYYLLDCAIRLHIVEMRQQL